MLPQKPPKEGPSAILKTKSSSADGPGKKKKGQLVHRSAAAEDAGKKDSPSNTVQVGERPRGSRDAASPMSQAVAENPASSSLLSGEASAVCQPASSLGASASQEPEKIPAFSNPVSPPVLSTSRAPDDAAAVSQPVSPLPVVSSSQQPQVDPVASSQSQPPAVSPSHQPEGAGAVSTQRPSLAARPSLPGDGIPAVPGPDFLPAVLPPLVVQTTISAQRRLSVLRAMRESRASISSRGNRKGSYNPDGFDAHDDLASTGYRSSLGDLSQERRGFPKCLRRLGTKTAAALGCTFLLAAAVLATVLLQANYGRGVGGWLCLTLDCTTHRNLLFGVINRSVDPCRDFEAFVCPQKAKSTYANAADVSSSVLLSSMRRRWLDGFQELLRDGQSFRAVANKAAVMYNSCLTHKPSTRDAVKQFIDALKVRWLEPQDPGANAFGVLLDVACNWQAPLWLRVAVLPRDAFQPLQRVLISRNPQMAQWQAALEGMNGFGEYQKRWRNMEGVNASDNAIYRSYETRMTIFRMFSNSLISTRVALRQFSLKVAPAYSSFAIDVTQLLNENIKAGQNFTKDDLIIFEDAHLLEVINAAFSRFENAELLQHVFWLFVDVYGPIADPTLFMSPGRGQDANKSWVRFCSSQVEASYYMLANSLFAISHLTPVDRQSIGELTTALHRKAVQLIREANWLEWRSKTKAIAKLEGLETILWPREEFLSEHGLLDVYRSFPDSASSFTDYWLKTRQALRNYATKNPHLSPELLGAPGGCDESLISYVHVLNTEFVSMAALTSPLFYDSGTQAMLFGGLGYQYAIQLVRALDTTGVTVDPYGSIVRQWLSGLSAAEYKKRVKCLGGVDEDIFPELPALELAYRAYISAMRTHGPRLFPSKTEEKVFFITACLGICTHYRGRSDRRCNKAVTAFRPFAKAFQCGSASPMNRPEKCTFFQ